MGTSGLCYSLLVRDTNKLRPGRGGQSCPAGPASVAVERPDGSPGFSRGTGRGIEHSNGGRRGDGDLLAAGGLYPHELGYHTIYSAAGPKILHLLLKGGVLDRLYLTQTNRLLGGQPFSSIVEGDLFDAPIGVNLHTLYFDSHGLDGLGQLFMSYNLANQPIPKSEMNPQ